MHDPDVFFPLLFRRLALVVVIGLLSVSCSDRLLFLITPEFGLAFPEENYLNSLSDEVKVRTLYLPVGKDNLSLSRMQYISFFSRIVVLPELEPTIEHYLQFFHPLRPPDIYWLQFSRTSTLSSGHILRFSRLEAMEESARALANQLSAPSAEAVVFWWEDIFTSEEREAFYRGYQSVRSLQSLREFTYNDEATLRAGIDGDLNTVREVSAWAFFLGEGLMSVQERIPSGWVVVESFLPEFGKLFGASATVSFDFRDVIRVVSEGEKMTGGGYVSARFIRY